MLVIGCKRNNADEPTPPAQYPTITMDMLKSYFPYQSEKKYSFNFGISNTTYTVGDMSFTSKGNKIYANITLNGIRNYSIENGQALIILTAEVTDNHFFKATFEQCGIDRNTGEHIFPSGGSFYFDTSKDGNLPEKIVFSDGSVLKKSTGLISYLNADKEEYVLNIR